MSTITTTVDQVRAAVRIDVDMSDVQPPYIAVNRVVVATGAVTAVRPYGYTIGGWAQSPGGTVTLYDTEMPLDTQVYYTASYNSAGAMNVANDNPYFEQALISPWTGANGATLASVTTQAFSGSYSMRVTSNGTAATQALSEEMAVVSTLPYVATGRLYAAQTGTYNVGISWYDAGHAFISNSNSSASLAINTWTLVGNTPGTAFTPPGTARFWKLFTSFGGTLGTGLFWYADEILGGPVMANYTVTSGYVSVPSLGYAWLRDPLRPANSIRMDMNKSPYRVGAAQGVTLLDYADKTRKSNGVLLNVNNSPYPISLTRARSALTSTLRLLARSASDRDAVNALLATGGVVLLQLPQAYNEPDRYLFVGDAIEGRAIQDFRKPPRVFSLPVSEQGAPAGPMQGATGSRWSDISPRWTTWSQVTGAGYTWLQVRQGVLD